MDTIRICNECRQPLPENAPEGLCPACLAKVALGSEPAAAGARIAPEVAELAPDFPQLEILELLGMGGMGMVYKARQPRLDRIVALKILPMDSAQHPSFAERFNREAKALAKLNHPGIVDIYDFGQTGQYYYFVMEYVDGMNLRQLLNNQSVTPRQALELVVQICTALQYAHDEGVVHRDIKPENILLNKKGQVKIADFGLAKLLGTAPDTALTMSQAAMGTMNYMAPEQRQNAQGVDHRADIYSLGVVFYEMLTGEVPMGRFEPPSKRVQVDVRLDEVVLKALEREPARRYQQVSEVKTGVETITSTMPQEKKGTGAPGAFKPQPPRGFVSFVVKWFAMTAGAWLAVGFCLHWMLGDAQMTTTLKENVWSWSLGDWAVTFAPHESVPIYYTLLGLGASCFYLGIARIVLPASFTLVVFAWFETRARRGLKLRQLPSPVRRRYWLWMSAITSGYVAVAWGSVIVFATFSHPKSISQREFQNLADEATEWWFVPNSGAYEKLGLKATFAAPDQSGTNNSSSWPACTVSLIVHDTNAEPAVMKVTLPGLRASYRFPATNNWDYNFILDKDSFIEWLHKEAGLSPTGSKFQQEVTQIYGLLKAYELQPPQTVKEFVNLAKADLRDFGFGGFYGGGFSFGGFEGPSIISPLLLLGGATLLYMVMTIWATRRLFEEAWVEIEAGRWTPPQKAKAPPVVAAPATSVFLQARLSRTALIGAVWIPWFFFAALAFATVEMRRVPLGSTSTGPAWWQVALLITLSLPGVTAPFGTTILGYVALSQIRHSAGRLYGLGLAFFDALVFPLLVVDYLVMAAGGVLATALLSSAKAQDAATVVDLLVVVVLDFFIVRTIWRFYSRKGEN
jgi:tRNA A-37 threonylcarbamoyl transferase component Bud32